MKHIISAHLRGAEAWPRRCLRRRRVNGLIRRDGDGQILQGVSVDQHQVPAPTFARTA